MIGTDEPMVLILEDQNNNRRKSTYYLGYMTLSAEEMDLLRVLVEKNGYYIYLSTVEEDFPSFNSLFVQVRKDCS